MTITINKAVKGKEYPLGEGGPARARAGLSWCMLAPVRT